MRAIELEELEETLEGRNILIAVHEDQARLAHLEQQVQYLQERNTELVEKTRSQERTIEALRRCEESLRDELRAHSS